MKREERIVRDWKQLGLAWLFWGAAGGVLNAIPWGSDEFLGEVAGCVGVIAIFCHLAVIVAFYEQGLGDGPLGRHGLTWGGEMMAFCVMAGGFALVHFAVKKPAVLRSQPMATLFLVHSLLAAAYAACMFQARKDKDYARYAHAIQRIGRVTGGISLILILASVAD